MADALDICANKLKLPDFQGCQPTIEFIRSVNKLFDIFNSRNMAQLGFKKPVYTKNHFSIFTFFTEMEFYLMNLKTCTGSYIINTNKKTGYLG